MILDSQHTRTYPRFYFLILQHATPGTIKDNSKEDFNDVLNSKIKRLEMDNLHLRTQTENLKNANAKVLKDEMLPDRSEYNHRETYY